MLCFCKKKNGITSPAQAGATMAIAVVSRIHAERGSSFRIALFLRGFITLLIRLWFIYFKC